MFPGRAGPGLARLFMGEGKGAPSPASAGSFPPGGAGMLLPRDGLLDDPPCPQERQIPVPGRKFLTEDGGKLFVFPEDNSIGRFGVETARPRPLPRIQLCTTCVFCPVYVDYEA